MSGALLWRDDDRMRRNPPHFLVANVYPDARPHSLLSWRFLLDGYKVREPLPLPKSVYILEERLWKQPSREWLRARLGLADLTSAASAGRGTRRYQAPLEQRSDADVLAELEERAAGMAEHFRAIGTTVIYLFMPSPHYSIYAQMIANLRARGVWVVDFPPTEAYPKGYPDDYWQAADSHWTEKAVRETAAKILDEMNEVRVAEASGERGRAGPADVAAPAEQQP